MGRIPLRFTTFSIDQPAGKGRTIAGSIMEPENTGSPPPKKKAENELNQSIQAGSLFIFGETVSLDQSTVDFTGSKSSRLGPQKSKVLDVVASAPLITFPFQGSRGWLVEGYPGISTGGVRGPRLRLIQATYGLEKPFLKQMHIAHIIQIYRYRRCKLQMC